MLQRQSTLFLPTLREDPADAEAASHKLLVRAGLIRQVGTGLWTYLPAGWRAYERVVGIIRDEMDAIDTFNEKLQANGHWVFAGGLGAPDTATVVDGRGDEPTITDGPFVESKEYLAGFWIITAPDLDAALRLAAEGSKACNRKLELRPFLG